jgi:hypothetical protein
MADKKIQFEQPSGLLIFFNRFWIIVTAILIGALLLGGYYFVIKPKMDSNDLLRDNALQVSTDKRNSEALLKNLENLETTYKNIKNNRQADLDRLKEIVPTNPQIAELFVLSDRLAQQYGLQLLDISISDEQAKKDSAPQVAPVADDSDESSPTPASATTAPTPKGPILKTLTVNFKVVAATLRDELGAPIGIASNKTSYQLFKDFLDALERNLRLTDIQTVNFSSLQEDTVNPVQFQFAVQTYYR